MLSKVAVTPVCAVREFIALRRFSDPSISTDAKIVAPAPPTSPSLSIALPERWKMSGELKVSWPPVTVVPAAADIPSSVAFPAVVTVTLRPSAAVSSKRLLSKVAVTPVEADCALIALRKAESESLANTEKSFISAPFIVT